MSAVFNAQYLAAYQTANMYFQCEIQIILSKHEGGQLGQKTLYSDFHKKWFHFKIGGQRFPQTVFLNCNQTNFLLIKSTFPYNH